MDSAAAIQQSTSFIQPDKAPETIQHHPELYFSDGNLVIIAKGSNVRFKIYRGLVNRSEYFKAMLSPDLQPAEFGSAQSATPEVTLASAPANHLQAGGWLESDKGTEEHPLILDSVAFNELELVIRWLTGMLHRPVSTENWVTLLATATYMMFEDLKREAVHELTPRLPTELQASEVVSLAYTYRVPSWLSPGLIAFLSLSPSSLTTDDILNVGEKVTLAYIQLHHNISCLRSALALWPPPFNHDVSCSEVARCKGEFARWWLQNISAVIHADLVQGRLEPPSGNPNWVKSVQTLLDRASYAALTDDYLSSDDKIEGMTRNCQVNGLQQCLYLPVFTQESKALMQAVGKLLADAAESDGLVLETQT